MERLPAGRVGGKPGRQNESSSLAADRRHLGYTWPFANFRQLAAPECCGPAYQVAVVIGVHCRMEGLQLLAVLLLVQQRRVGIQWLEPAKRSLACRQQLLSRKFAPITTRPRACQQPCPCWPHTSEPKDTMSTATLFFFSFLAILTSESCAQAVQWSNQSKGARPGMVEHARLQSTWPGSAGQR